MADQSYGERADAAREELASIKAEQEAEVKQTTEALAAEKGFPIETDEGTVLVVRKETTPNGFVTAISEDGTEFRSVTAGAVVFSRVGPGESAPDADLDEETVIQADDPEPEMGEDA